MRYEYIRCIVLLADRLQINEASSSDVHSSHVDSEHDRVAAAEVYTRSLRVAGESCLIDSLPHEPGCRKVGDRRGEHAQSTACRSDI